MNTSTQSPAPPASTLTPSPAVLRALYVARSLGRSATRREAVLLHAWAVHNRGGRPTCKTSAKATRITVADARVHVLELIDEGLWPARPREPIVPSLPVYGPPTPEWIRCGDPGPGEVRERAMAAREARLGEMAGARANRKRKRKQA